MRTLHICLNWLSIGGFSNSMQGKATRGQPDLEWLAPCKQKSSTGRVQYKFRQGLIVAAIVVAAGQFVYPEAPWIEFRT